MAAPQGGHSLEPDAMNETDTLTGEPRHWYLVSYTAHNPFEGNTVNATQEVALDYPWRPGDLKHVVRQLNVDMMVQGYERYTKPIITGVFYMGEH